MVIESKPWIIPFFYHRILASRIIETVQLLWLCWSDTAFDSVESCRRWWTERNLILEVFVSTTRPSRITCQLHIKKEKPGSFRQWGNASVLLFRLFKSTNLAHRMPLSPFLHSICSSDLRLSLRRALDFSPMSLLRTAVLVLFLLAHSVTGWSQALVYIRLRSLSLVVICGICRVVWLAENMSVFNSLFQEVRIHTLLQVHRQRQGCGCRLLVLSLLGGFGSWKLMARRCCCQGYAMLVRLMMFKGERSTNCGTACDVCHFDWVCCGSELLVERLLCIYKRAKLVKSLFIWQFPLTLPRTVYVRCDRSSLPYAILNSARVHSRHECRHFSLWSQKYQGWPK